MLKALSLPPREAWIEITLVKLPRPTMASLPPREAWIEIPAAMKWTSSRWSFPPREAWIEITVDDVGEVLRKGRFPRGKRGLKYGIANVADLYNLSFPPREAWIEIGKGYSKIPAKT